MTTDEKQELFGWQQFYDVWERLITVAVLYQQSYHSPQLHLHSGSNKKHGESKTPSQGVWLTGYLTNHNTEFTFVREKINKTNQTKE